MEVADIFTIDSNLYSRLSSQKTIPLKTHSNYENSEKTLQFHSNFIRNITSKNRQNLYFIDTSWNAISKSIYGPDIGIQITSKFESLIKLWVAIEVLYRVQKYEWDRHLFF